MLLPQVVLGISAGVAVEEEAHRVSSEVVVAGLEAAEGVAEVAVVPHEPATPLVIWEEPGDKVDSHPELKIKRFGSTW